LGGRTGCRFGKHAREEEAEERALLAGAQGRRPCTANASETKEAAAHTRDEAMTGEVTHGWIEKRGHQGDITGAREREDREGERSEPRGLRTRKKNLNPMVPSGTRVPSQSQLFHRYDCLPEGFHYYLDLRVIISLCFLCVCVAIFSLLSNFK
jgi:hypothetical protein